MVSFSIVAIQRKKNLRAGAAYLLMIAVQCGIAVGFDTGPHFDLTQAVLSERGFGDDAIKITQVENWLTDYYSSSPTIAGSKRDELEKLHFDNLFTTDQVINYWSQLINNVRTETQNAARQDDPLAALTVLGIALHAVQDFYSHSNWVETHPRPSDGTYRTDTYAQYANSKTTLKSLTLFTGKYPTDRTYGPGPDRIPANVQIHGDYESGLNHDSLVRPRWDQAYVFAYAASHEIVEAIAKWADETRPGFWKSVISYAVDTNLRKKLDYDVSALRNMSMWINGKGADGHWKGNKSGSKRFFSAFSTKWIGSDSSVFVRQMRDGTASRTLSSNLYSGALPPPMPDLPRFSLQRRAILVRTLKIKQQSDSGNLRSEIGKLAAPDYYARTRIGSQEFCSRTIQGSSESIDPWQEIYFAALDDVNVPIRISVWDEDDIDSAKDQATDINPVIGKNTLDLIFNTATGQISGDLSGNFNSPETAFTSSGEKPDKKRAAITAYVTQYPLK
ncbi:MAG: hypothetical protein JO053_14935 [Acidobacteria bacterium]|nr:hypothetical protein [Acidobacteriota bacterium]